jgi:hypothetical protein
MFSRISSKQRLGMAIATVAIGGASLAVATGFGDGETARLHDKASRAAAPEAALAAGTLGGSDATDGFGSYRAFGVRLGTSWARTAERTAEAFDGLLSSSATAAGLIGETGTAGQPGPDSMPRRVTVDLPAYEAGRAPSATPPSVEKGEAPSVEPGWTTTVDLGTAPQVTAPTVDRGEPGTMKPPAAHVA